MAKTLDEKFIRRSIIEWLGRQGFDRRLREKGTEEHGIDISVRHRNYPVYYFVEAKGEPDPKKVKHPRSRIEVSFLQALGQIVTRIKSKAHNKYAIGFPDSFANTVLRRIPWLVCKKLNLNILLVSKSRKVTPYTWKELKRGQSSKNKDLLRR